MTENKANYGEYIILGINKALLAFLISFVVCLGISLLINTVFYQQIVMITVGTLGEAGQASPSTILRTASLILGLSTFQMSGKFQMGAVLLGIIPLVSFFVSGIIFRIKRKEGDKDLFSSVIIDGLAALIYSVFLLISAFVTKGELFGLQINFVSWWNFGISFAFLLFIQFIMGINRHKKFTAFTPGLVLVRSLLRVVIGFSATTGALLILYYLAPYLKSVTRIVVFMIVAIPNIAVYLSFTLMGISLDLADSLGKLTQYFNIDLTFFSLPVEIRLVLMIAFIIVVFVTLIRLPIKQYWSNLIVYALGFGASTCILALISKVDLGYVRGAFNISFSHSPILAFAVPFIVILLDGILLALIRMICREIKGEDCFFVTKGKEVAEPEDDMSEVGQEEAEAGEMLDAEEKGQEVEVENELEEEGNHDKEIDYWNELAKRSVANTKKEKLYPWQVISKIENNEQVPNDLKNEEEPEGKEPEEAVRRQDEVEDIKEEKKIEEVEVASQPDAIVSPEREVDIRLFPKKEKPAIRKLMDFSDMEDDIYLEEYEAEETLKGFSEEEQPDFGEEYDSDDMDATIIVKKDREENDLEKTIPYRLHSGKTEEETLH